jgi:hypothetical protein
MLHIFAGDLPHTVGCVLDSESLYIVCWPVLCTHGHGPLGQSRTAHRYSHPCIHPLHSKDMPMPIKPHTEQRTSP